jgi:hypothetical protein
MNKQSHWLFEAPFYIIPDLNREYYSQIDIQDYSYQNEQRSRWLSQLSDLIAFPTISALPKHRQDLKAYAQWLARHLAELGLQHVRILSSINGALKLSFDSSRSVPYDY